MTSKRRAICPQDAVNGLYGRKRRQGRAKIRICLGPLKVGRTYCSSRCRLLKWAVRALGEALEYGKAEGLRDQFGELSAGPCLTVEMVHTRDLGKYGDPRNGGQDG